MLCGNPNDRIFDWCCIDDFFDVEKLMPQISADITARRKAEAEARGEVYISPEEKAAEEQARMDQLAEGRRPFVHIDKQIGKETEG